jgi:glutathione peroxidase
MERLNGGAEDFKAYEGKTVLVVNTASHCGYTSQYRGLEDVFKKYEAQGFVVLGFPCNQFGKQEPGTPDEISSFCQKNYGVSFPMFAKVDVNGKRAHPLFDWLKSEAPGLLGTTMIKWNFTKFLISPDGKAVHRYGSSTKPREIESDIRRYISSKT